MTIASISTLASRDVLRTTVLATQRRVDATAREIGSGRHDDLGLTLGGATRGLVVMRELSSEIATITETNAVAAVGLEHVQAAMTEMIDLANGLFSSATAARHAGGDRSLLVADARARLATLTELVSSTANGAHIFGGTNSASVPMQDYLVEPPGTARAAVEAAFTSAFGFAPDDPLASTLTPAQLGTYLDGPYAALFDDAPWTATFSSASDRPLRMRIALNEVIEVPVSANSPEVRMLVSALVGLIDTGLEHMSAETGDALLAHVADRAATAAAGLVERQSRVGLEQMRITRASERLTAQRTVLETELGRRESVDLAEASTRLALLTSRLEAAYAVTARLHRMSIIDYL